MSTAVILAAGELPRKPYPLYLLQSADILVCCDGAFAGFLRRMPKLFGGWGRLPDAVVGDMDSLPKALQERYPSLMHPVSEQDDNDQTKAVRYVLDHHPEVSEIHILGATGRRADHTIGNLSLLMEYPRLFAAGSSPATDPRHSTDKPWNLPTIDIVSDYGTAFAITDSCELHVGQGRRVSLFSPDNTLVIRSEGLRWPTDGVIFDNWWKATLNRATADVIRLTLSHPSRALVILD